MDNLDVNYITIYGYNKSLDEFNKELNNICKFDEFNKFLTLYTGYIYCNICDKFIYRGRFRSYNNIHHFHKYHQNQISIDNK